MRVLRYRFVKYGVFLACISLLLGSCGEPIGDSGKSPVFLIIAAPGGDAANGVAVDVYTPGVPGNVTDTVFEEGFTIESIYKNQIESPATVFADVLLSEMRITYYRPDGNPNVPEPYTLIVTLRVPGGGSAQIQNVPIMKRSAKLLPPLKDLAFGGGEGEIHMTALVEFFGEDLAGNAVSCSRSLAILAADY